MSCGTWFLRWRCFRHLCVWFLDRGGVLFRVPSSAAVVVILAWMARGARPVGEPFCGESICPEGLRSAPAYRLHVALRSPPDFQSRVCFTTKSRLLRIPIGVQRPAATRKALSRSPTMEAGRATRRSPTPYTKRPTHDALWSLPLGPFNRILLKSDRSLC
jgi:hypothetical protein